MKESKIHIDELKKWKLIVGSIIIIIVIVSLIVQATFLTRYYALNLFTDFVSGNSVTLVIIGAALIGLYKLEEYIYNSQNALPDRLNDDSKEE